jgi:predicted metal-dependent phosphoesterase TrpH
MCIADHETVGGYLEVKDSMPAGVRLFCGVEYSTYREVNADGAASLSTGGEGVAQKAANAPSRGTQEIHILGYFPRGITGKMHEILKELQQERVNRAKVTLVNLRKTGCKLGYEQLMEHVGGDCVSRAHMARALMANGLVSSIYDAFKRYLDLSRGIVPVPLLTPERAITLISEEGGIPVWAHPEMTSFDLLVKEFIACGLKGVEICTRKRSETYSFYFERTAPELGLLLTYGSDYHGFSEEGLEGVTVPYSRVEGFLEMFEGKGG